MKSKTVFVCRECGNETPRWQGQCPACGAWNSIVEFEDKKAPARQNAVRGVARSAPRKLLARRGVNSSIWLRPAQWRLCPCWQNTACRW